MKQRQALTRPPRVSSAARTLAASVGSATTKVLDVTCLELAWKDRHLAQEAVRKLASQRCGCEQLGQIESRQFVKIGDLICKLISRKVGELPEITQSLFASGPIAAVNLARRSPVIACRRARYADKFEGLVSRPTVGRRRLARRGSSTDPGQFPLRGRTTNPFDVSQRGNTSALTNGADAGRASTSRRS